MTRHPKIDRPLLLSLAIGACTAGACAAPSATEAVAPPPTAEAAEPYLIRAKHPSARIWVGGQPTLTDLAAIRAAGITVVVNLRGLEETSKWGDERAAVEGLGMRYEAIPVASRIDVNEDKAARLAAVLAETKEEKVLLHCRSGNRVGALMALIAQAQGASTDEALEVGRAHGLTKLESVVRAKLVGEVAP